MDTGRGDSLFNFIAAGVLTVYTGAVGVLHARKVVAVADGRPVLYKEIRAGVTDVEASTATAHLSVSQLLHEKEKQNLKKILAGAKEVKIVDPAFADLK